MKTLNRSHAFIYFSVCFLGNVTCVHFCLFVCKQNCHANWEIVSNKSITSAGGIHKVFSPRSSHKMSLIMVLLMMMMVMRMMMMMAMIMVMMVFLVMMVLLVMMVMVVT